MIAGIFRVGADQLNVPVVYHVMLFVHQHETKTLLTADD